jgi:hypothetical protein
MHFHHCLMTIKYMWSLAGGTEQSVVAKGKERLFYATP